MKAEAHVLTLPIKRKDKIRY